MKVGRCPDDGISGIPVLRYLPHSKLDHVHTYTTSEYLLSVCSVSGTLLSLYIFCHIKYHKVKWLMITELDLNQEPRILTIIPFLYYL